MLGQFGVTPNAESAYLALVSGALASLADVAATTGLGPEELDRALDELFHVNLLMRASEEPLGFRVVPPHHGLDILIQREEDRLVQRRAALDATRTQASSLLDGYVAARVRSDWNAVESIDDPAVVRARLTQLVRDVRQEAWSTHLGGALSPRATQDSLALDRQLSRRGIACRMIVGRESRGPDHWNDYLKEVSGLGHRVRLMDAVPCLLIILDKRVALVPSATSHGGTGAHVLHGESLVRPLVILFEELWGVASPLQAADEDSDDTGIGIERMQQVASLLATGMKDEAIARRLVISARTVRRAVASLMAHFDAASRFQVACCAVRAGWLPAFVPSSPATTASSLDAED